MGVNSKQDVRAEIVSVLEECPERNRMKETGSRKQEAGKIEKWNDGRMIKKAGSKEHGAERK